MFKKIVQYNGDTYIVIVGLANCETDGLFTGPTTEKELFDPVNTFAIFSSGLLIILLSCQPRVTVTS